MALRLTAGAIEAEIKRAGSKGEIVTQFADGHGLALRIRNGVPSFVYVYRFHGKSRKLKLGAVGEIPLRGTVEKPGAVELAQAAAHDLRAGRDPSETRRETQARRMTFAELLELYLADLAARADAGRKRGRRSTVAEARRLAAAKIEPALGSLEVEAVTVEKVTRWHARLADTPASANRAQVIARAAWRFGMKRALVPQTFDPFAAVVRFDEVGKRERYSLKELERVGVALREAEEAGTIPRTAALGFRLFAFTAMRRSEVLGHAAKDRRSEGDILRWSDVDLEEGVIRLRRAKAGARDVVLARPMLEALRKAKPADAAPDDPVCASPRGGAAVRVEKPLHGIFARAGVPWRGLHALRRTFASIAAEQGLGEYVIAALLGHSARSVTGGYVIASNDPVRLAADRVVAEIAGALDGTRAPVLDFKRRAEIGA